MEHLRYPNESTEYRAARNALLNDEIALRDQIEAVAAKRRAIATTRIILVTPQSFPRACVHSIAFRTARIGTKRYLTCSKKMTEQSVTFGAPR